MRSITLFVGDETGLHDAPENYDRRRVNLRPKSLPDKIFGTNITRRRIALGLTQEQMGEVLGIHQVTLCRLETGSTPLTDKRRASIEIGLAALEKNSRGKPTP